MNPSTKIDCTGTLWDSMTCWDKCKWFIHNKLFPKLGNDLRTIYTLRAEIKSLCEKLGEECDEEVVLPSWGRKDPWNVILVNMLIQPVKPLEYIKLNFSVTKDGVTFNDT